MPEPTEPNAKTSGALTEVPTSDAETSATSPDESAAAQALGNETLIAPQRGPTEAQRYGDFLVIDKLGAGAMGIVYRARQLINERPTQRIVALKVLKPELTNDASFEERFFREAEHALNLRHENIVEGFAARKENGVCFLAMELIEGQTLTDLVSERSPLDVGDALRITLDVARGLQHAHASGVYHRDVKPGNVMISRGGEVKVTDLGLAKAPARDLELTHNGQVVGTPVYMAPEQSQPADRPDARFDVYALGGTLFYLLTGVSPFTGATVEEILAEKRRGAAPSARAVRPDVPAEVDALLRRMLARDPTERFQSMQEVIDAITASGLAHRPLSWVGGKTVPPQPLPWARYGKIGGALAGAAAIAAVVFAVTGRKPPEPPVSPTKPPIASTSAHSVIATAVKDMVNGEPKAAIDQLERGLATDPQNAQLADAVAEAKRGVFTFLQYARSLAQQPAAKYRPTTEDLQLAAGAWYRVGLALTRDCYVYVFQRDPEGEVYLLHPHREYSSEANPLPASLRWIPDKPGATDLLQLSGPPGQEYIYVLAFNAPMRAEALARVEQLLRGNADAVGEAVRDDVPSLLEPQGEPAATCFAKAPWAVFSFQHGS